MEIRVKLPQVFTILRNIHVTYAVQNFIFYVKIHVKIARLLTELFVMAKFFRCLI